MCSQCAALEGEDMHFNQTMKNPSKTKYPFFLGFYTTTTNGSGNLPMAANTSIDVSSTVAYDLVAISFYNGVHYVANVRFGDIWFEYDGKVLPQPEDERQTRRSGTYSRTMRPLVQQNMYEEFCVGGYCPVFWKYCRRNPSNDGSDSRFHSANGGVQQGSLQPQFHELERIQMT